MIARHFAFDALRELMNTAACDVKDSIATERILRQLIRSSINHARSQVDGRKTGTMTFHEAMRLVHTRDDAMVTRPAWDILRAVVLDDERSLSDLKLDNCDGNFTGVGKPFTPTDEDRTATDWMLYQAPQDNWVELYF